MSVTGRSNPAAPLEIPERTDAVQELVEWFHAGDEDSGRLRIPSQPLPLSDLEVWEQLFAARRATSTPSSIDGDLSVCRDDHSLAVILAGQPAWPG